MPKVCVIIPVYGVEKYIERCARSLFEQTLDDMEFIFVDDCTKDDSIEILLRVLKDYPKREKQVSILKHESNRGLPQARKSGIMVATGDYIANCDSDDWVDTDMYRAMYEKAISEEADVVVCDYASSDGTKHQVHKGCLHTDKEQFIRDMCSMQTSWSACNKLVKTSLLHSGIIYPEGNMGEDMALILQIALKASKVAYVPKALYYYYVNAQSITQIQTEDMVARRFNQCRANAEIVFSAFEERGLLKEYSNELLVIKWNVKRMLETVVHTSRYYSLWFHTYPEVNVGIWLNSSVSIVMKLKFLLTLLSLYPRKRDWTEVN